MMNEYDDLITGRKPGDASEYDRLIQDANSSDRNALRQSMTSAARTTPDRSAEVIQLSQRTRLPTDVVERNIDTVRSRSAIEDNDYDAMIKQSPKLAEWLQTGENAAVARDDVAKLGALEWIVTAPQRAWRQGWAQVEFGSLRSQSIFRELNAAEYKRLAELKAEMTRGGDLGAETWFGKALVGGAQQLPMLFSGMMAGAKTGVPTAIGAAGAAALAGQLGPQVVMPEELATIPAAAATGYYVGQTTGSMRFMFDQEAGQAYEEFSNFKDNFGRPLDPMVAKAAAITAGAINAPLESFQINTLLRSIPGADKLAGGITRNVIKQALMIPSVRAALGQMMLRYGSTLSQEVMTEVAQRTVTIMSGEIAKLASGQDIKRKGGMDIVADLANEGIQAAQAFTYIVAPGPTMRLGQDVLRIREAKKNEIFFNALGEQVADSKLYQRLPEKMQEFIARATKDGPVENVYIPAEAWVTYWQDKGLDPKAVAEEVTGSTKFYEEAIASGADITIPLSTYATRLAPTEHNAFFTKELRLGPDEMNAREAAELETVIAEQAKAARAQTEADSPLDSEAAQVKAQIVERLVGAGVEQSTAEAYATGLYESPFRSLVSRSELPVEFFKKLFDIQVGQGEGVQQELPLGDRRKADTGGAQRVATTDRRQNLAGRVDRSLAMLSEAEAKAKEIGAKVAQTPTPELTAQWKAAREAVGKLTMEVKRDRLELEKHRATTMQQSRKRAMPLASVSHAGKQFETGKPVTFDYLRNPEKAPEPGPDDQFAQNIEPAGRYMTLKEIAETPDYLEAGAVSFNNPLVIEQGEGLYSDETNWKRVLSKAYDGLTGEKLSRAIAADGYDGIVTVGKHKSGEQFTSEIVDLTMFAGRREIDPLTGELVTASPRLSVSHNLSAENLIAADEMGGIPVPSLAVTPGNVALSGFGEITLIGRQGLGDPSDVPIFDADIYSGRFPRPEYDKVKTAVAQKMVDRVRPFSKKFDDYNLQQVTWDEAVNTPDPSKIIQAWLRGSGAKAMFLSEHGVEVEPVMRSKHVQFPWAADKAFRAVFDRVYPLVDSADAPDRLTHPGLKELGDAARAAIKRHVEKVGDKIDDERDFNHYAMYFGQDGSWLSKGEPMPWVVMEKMRSDLRNIGQKEVDRTKTEKRLNDKLKGREQEFTQWANDNVMSMFGHPFLRTRQGKQSYTLKNIVDVMTGKLRAVERTMTYGEGKARAAASKQFRDLEQMRRAAERDILPDEDVSTAREETKKALEEWRTAVVKYYRPGEYADNAFGRVWEGNDSAMKALAQWAKRGKNERNLRSALAREGFKIPDYADDIIERGVEVGKMWLHAPVPYFEAKPQRAVKLSEFAGAVIPTTAPDKVREILSKHGIPFKEYSNKGAKLSPQQSMVIQFREELAAKGETVLFQSQIDSSSVVDSLMVTMGGPDRSKWNAQTKKNAADWGEIQAKRTQSPEMKAKYEHAVKVLRGEVLPNVLFQGATIDNATGEVLAAPTFYSALSRQIEAAKIETAPADQWKAYINSLLNKGVKKEEINLSGVLDWLDLSASNPQLTVMQLEDFDSFGVVDKDNRTVSPRFSGKTSMLKAKEAAEDWLRENKPPASGRVTKQQVIDFLADKGVKIEEKILGEPPAGTMPQKAQEQQREPLPPGYTFIVNNEEGLQGTFSLFDPDHDELEDDEGNSVWGTYQEAADVAWQHYEENTEEISDEDVRERAIKLWEDQLQEEAEDAVKDSDYLDYRLVFRLPNVRIVKLPADMLRLDDEYGIQLIDYGFEKHDRDETPDTYFDRDLSKFDDGTKLDDLDELGEPRFAKWLENPYGGTFTFGTEKIAQAHIDATADLYNGKPYFSAIFYERDEDIGEHETFVDAKSEAESVREGIFEDEVRSYMDNASVEDHGDYWFNQAREELTDEAEANGRAVRGAERRYDIPDPNVIKNRVRHPGRWQSLGGRDYRELVLFDPAAEPYNAGDSTHFQTDTGGRTIAWSRFKIRDDAKGVPTLWIEENQSQRAQHGREQGFRREPTKEETDKLANMWSELARLEVERNDAIQAVNDGFGTKFGNGRTLLTAAFFSAHVEAKIADDAITRERADTLMNNLRDVDARWQKAHDVYAATEREIKGGPVPSAPFTQDTKAWVALLMKRLIRYAVDHGITQIAWTQGAEQVKRYEGWLREQVDNIEWEKAEGGKFAIKAKQRGNTKVEQVFSDKELVTALGSDMARQIIDDPAESGILEGDDIRIDDLGMAKFYGDAQGKNPDGKPAIVAMVSDKIVRSLGGKGVKTIDITVKENDATFEGAAGFEITDTMKERALGGQSLFQNDKRGSISFGFDRQFRIDLLEGADLSTFIHESGHFYLEVLGDVVSQLRAIEKSARSPQQQKMIEDYDAILKWLGVESRDQIKVEHHEKFARGIEAYLMEGKAPSAALRSLFARFRAWLLAVYQSMRQLNVNLTPEVREVMDRIFTTDQEIEAASKEAEVSALFADDAKLTEAGFDRAFIDAYRQQVQKASDTARDELQAKIMQTLQREREAWWKSEREKMREEIAKEIYTRREYIAIAAMQKMQQPNGEALPEGKESVEAIKLDRRAIAAIYGADFWKSLPRGITVIEGGVHPNLAAEVFGFGSGDELVQAVKTARPMRTVIDTDTDAAMRQKHGDVLVDGTMIDAARAAVQNEERVKVIDAELRALVRLQRAAAPAVTAERQGQAQARRAGVETVRAAIPPIQAIRNMAAGRIAQMMVRDLRPATYLMAAVRASKAAIEAAAKDDYTGALAAKQRELMNVELYRAAVKAQDEVADTVTYMHGFTETRKRARIAKAGQDYLDQIDGFLDRYEFAKVSLKTLERRKNLAQWIAEKERAGEQVNLPDEMIEESRRVNYKEMSVEELRGVRDSVKHIEHIARLKNRLLTAKQKRELAEVVEDITKSIIDNSKAGDKKKFATRLPKDEAMRLVDSWFASHRKLSSIVRQMDGFKDGGQLWEYVLRPINEAADNETTMNADATKRLIELFDNYKGKDAARLYTKMDIPAIGESLSKMERLMVALNWGNDGNRQKLMDGYGLVESQIVAILDTLDERDWRFVQGMFDFIETYWPMIEAKEKRVNGVAPEKVDAMPISTKFGEFRGGYFPIKYDDRQSPRAYADLAKEAAENAIKGNYSRATTRRGHTKARVEGVERKIRLDFGVIFEHVGQVIHDVTHHEMLIDVNRILGSKQIQEAIIDRYGDIAYKEMQEIVTDIASGDVASTKAFEKVINWTRSGVTIAGLAWNVMTSLLQPFGIAQSIVRVGPQWIGRGMSRWLRDAASMENTAAWIQDKSPMMKHRASTQMREINEIKNHVGLKSGTFSGWVDEVMRTVSLDTVTKQGVVDSFFWLIYKGQQIADIPTWLGAYEKAMSEGNDDARSVALADQAVLDSQGGGEIKDLAGIQRGGPLLRLWTNFYSYFNVTWNLSVESVRRTNYRDPIALGRLAVDMLLLYTLPATLTELMRHALVGGDDDPDKLREKLLRANLSYMLGTMVGLREIGSVVQGFSGYEGPAGTRFFSSVSKLIKQTEQGDLDAAFWRSLNDAAGIVLHYPAGQVRRTVEGYIALQEGQTRNPMALLVGPPKE